MSETINVLKDKDVLVDKKVVVKPITKQSWLPSGHDGSFMYSGTTATFVLPIQASTGRLKPVLNEAEIAYFEKKLYLKEGALNFNNRKSEFWTKTFKIKLDKHDKILDLSDTFDNLTYRVMTKLPKFAPSWKERYDHPAYKWALCDLEEETKEKAGRYDKQKSAFKFFGKIEDDKKRMVDVLKVLGKRVSDTSKVEFLKSEIGAIIDDPKQIDAFLAIAEDKDYELKLLIENAVDCGAIIKDGMNYYLGSKNGELIGEGRDNVLAELNKKKNTSILQTIKAQVENVK